MIVNVAKPTLPSTDNITHAEQSIIRSRRKYPSIVKMMNERPSRRELRVNI
jgi:hypothetical protein